MIESIRRLGRLLKLGLDWLRRIAAEADLWDVGHGRCRCDECETTRLSQRGGW